MLIVCIITHFGWCLFATRLGAVETVFH